MGLLNINLKKNGIREIATVSEETRIMVKKYLKKNLC